MNTGGIHPWRRLRDLAHVTLLWHDGGPMGFTTFAKQTISLRKGMTYAERRCTVLHECLHIERGPVPVGMAAREELRVCKETARLMLPDVRVIADALAWSAGRVGEAAHELDVDEDTLRTRLRFMTHPAERGYMLQRFPETAARAM